MKRLHTCYHYPIPENTLMELPSGVPSGFNASQVKYNFSNQLHKKLMGQQANIKTKHGLGGADNKASFPLDSSIMRRKINLLTNILP